MKNKLQIPIIILLLSVFNTFTKYINVKNALYDLNKDSQLLSGYITSSTIAPPYLKIFIFTVVLTSLFIFIIILIKNKYNEKLSIENKKITLLIVLLLISIITLYLNTFIGFLVLIASLFSYIYQIYKNLREKKLIICFILLLILYLLLFYYISF